MLVPCCFQGVKAAGQAPKLLKEYPNLNAYLERRERDEGVRPAMKEQGLIKQTDGV